MPATAWMGSYESMIILCLKQAGERGEKPNGQNSVQLAAVKHRYNSEAT